MSLLPLMCLYGVRSENYYLYDQCEWNTAKKTYTGLFEIIVGVLTTCHTQYPSDISLCVSFI